MTLCYMERDNKYLMLHRNKKKNDINKGKWIGVGGKLEKDESPMQSIHREIKEETGYTANTCNFRGLVEFNYNDNPTDHMYLYTCQDFYGEIKECDEGDLAWIKKTDVFSLNLWEGDKIFLDLIMKDCPFFHLILDYKNDKLINHSLEFGDEIEFRNENFLENLCE